MPLNMEDSPLPIALFADENILAGLHVTLYSALANWGSASPMEIHLFHDHLDPADLFFLEETLQHTGKPFTFHERGVSVDQFKNCKSLHANWMTYGRLLLPELMPESPCVIYLDSDLIVNLSLTALGGFLPALRDFALGAVSLTTFEWSLDCALCRELGLDPAAKSFNAGVLLLNLEKWRSEHLTEKCVSFAGKHALQTVDQGALNFVFYNAFLQLPGRFNVELYASSAPVSPEGKICHFVGSPKPFDFLGNLFSNHYKMFRSVMNRTAYSHWRVNSMRQALRRRNLALLKSYGKALKEKFRK